MRTISQIVTDVAALKGVRINDTILNALVAQLLRAPYSIEEIREASIRLAAMETPHTRPLDWASWIKAFQEPMYTSHEVGIRIQRASAKAYDRGKVDGRKEAEEAARRISESPIASNPREYLQALKTNHLIRETIDRLKAGKEVLTEKLERSEERIHALQAELTTLRHGKKILEERYKRLKKCVPEATVKKIEEEQNRAAA